MKKTTKALVFLLALAMLVSCGAGKQQQVAETTPVVEEVQASTYGKGSNELVYDKTTGLETESTADSLDYGTWNPSSEDVGQIPWTGDMAQLAKADGTLRFYFMAGEGKWISGDGEKIGDGCVVFFPNGQVMLIDSCVNGQSDNADGYVKTFIANLKRMGITHIDYYVQSHGHADHNGAMNADNGILQNGFTIGHLYYNGTTAHSKLLSVCQKYGVPYSTLNEGMSLDIGDVHIDVYNPEPSTDGKEAPKYDGDTDAAPQNNVSIVMKFTYQGVKVLFDGDLYEEGMDRVASRYPNGELEADMMKICHHGHSETSISPTYVKAVSPKYAVIASACTVNTVVYDMYTSAGASVRCDYCEGYMIFAVKDNKIYSKTSRVNTSDYYDVYTKGDIAEAPIELFQPSTEKVKYPKGTKHAKTAAEFLAALQSDATYIVLDNDIDLASENVKIALDVTGKTIDLAGHSIKGITCTKVAGASVASIQSCQCSFNLRGSDFTLTNGNLILSADGGYALVVNQRADVSGNYGESTKFANVLIKDIAIPNGGIETHSTDITLENCRCMQPSTYKPTSNVSTISVNYGLCHVIGGEYYNYETTTGIDYLRWIKVRSGQAWATNGVKHNAAAGHYMYVDHSMFYAGKSTIVL